MKIPVLVCVCLLGGWGLAAAQSPAPPSHWQAIFNGHDLDGWTPKLNHLPLGDDPKRTFVADRGVLRVSYQNYTGFYDQFGHLFYRVPYAHYRLRLEYRFVGENMPGAPFFAIRNSGVMIHSQAPKSVELNQPFPVSFEVQLLQGLGTEKRSTANLCTPGTVAAVAGVPAATHCIDSNSPTYSGDQWVKLEVLVDGAKEARNFINGVEVLRYSALEIDPTDLRAMQIFLRNGATSVALGSGYIALQAEGHPMEFRNIEIMNLEQRAAHE